MTIDIIDPNGGCNDTPVLIIPRHEGHSHGPGHYANMKYGYIAFILSFGFVALISLRNSLIIKRVIPQRYLKYAKVPLVAAVLFWFFFIAFFCTVNIQEFDSRVLGKRTGRYVKLLIQLYMAYFPIPWSIIRREGKIINNDLCFNFFLSMKLNR